MKHTPGPWKEGSTADSVVSAFGEGVKQYHDKGTVQYYGGYIIAESVAPCNRSLIEAAPDLLVACRAALDHLERTEEWIAFNAEEQYQSLVALREKIRAAIVKADGRE